MKLPAVLESVEGIEEAKRVLYVQVEGKWVLNVDGIDAHPEVKNLKSAHEKTKVRLREATGEIATLREQAAAIGDTTEEVDQLQAELQTTRSLLARKVIEGDLAASMTRVGVKPASRALVLDHFRAKGPRVVEDADGNPVAAFETEVGSVLASDLVDSWALTDDALHHLSPTGKGGSGAPSSGGMPMPSARVTFDRSDPLAWGKHAAAVVKGDATAR